jgi:hypothetical protein
MLYTLLGQKSKNTRLIAQLMKSVQASFRRSGKLRALFPYVTSLVFGIMEAYLVFMHTLVVWWVNGWETGIGEMVAGWGYKYSL